MSARRYDLNDLTSDIAHLSTLIDVITDFAIDIIDPDREPEDYKSEVGRLTDLLWIARDLASTISNHGEDVHHVIFDEKDEIRKAVKS